MTTNNPYQISINLSQLSDILLRDVGLLTYYDEDTSLKGNYGLLVHLIHRWDVHRHAFHVGLDQWYHPTERIFNLSLGYPGEGGIFPSSHMSQ
jgi:hypothetical protein